MEIRLKGKASFGLKGAFYCLYSFVILDKWIGE